jgi:outer membrane protein OmpA-like peptidoglycan-associated protein
LISKDHGALPIPPGTLHLHGGFFYHDVLNQYFDDDGVAQDDRFYPYSTHDYYAYGVPLDIGYAFNERWELDATFQLLRWRRGGGTALSFGDTWVKVRRLFEPSDGYRLGPRLAVKLPTGDTVSGLGDGQADIDVGVVSAKYGGDGHFKSNGQLGLRYRLKNSDTDTQPGLLAYAVAEPGWGFGDDQKFILAVPLAFNYFLESKTAGAGNEDEGYGFAAGIKPTYRFNEKASLDLTVLYPIAGDNTDRELYVGFMVDSYLSLPRPVGDRDRDGLADNRDQCPDDPEDFDGYQDEDGCPDPDNDGDGIVDTVDKCPNEAEDFNDYEDEDGCPEGGKPVVPKKITLEGLRFLPERTELVPGSDDSLKAAGEILKDNPEVNVTIEGHAASTDRPDVEMKLSEGRAEMVRDYLIKNYGIGPNRIKAVGFGSTRPIAGNETEEGKRQNRRIEFVVN